MKIKKSLLTLVMFVSIICSFLTAHSQSTEEKIANIAAQYFDLDRENYHLQFNKSTYLTNETIWFKGFVFDKKNNTPYTETANIYVNFFTPEGEKIESKLFYAHDGIFQGDFKLNNNLKTGKYYFQVYTNWSNNFSEDESAVFRVEIINDSEGTITYLNNEPIIEFHPEGGIFLTGVNNIIGVSITDCNQVGLSLSSGKVLNAKGEEISSFQTNAFGYGKFEIAQARKENYQIVINYNNHQIKKSLPQPQETGTVLTVNNYSNESKTFISIRTNDQTKTTLAGKKLYLTVNQNDKINIVNVQVKENDNPIVLANTNLFNGVNIVRVIDENLNQLNERIIYKSHKNNFELNLETIKKNQDTIQINGSATASNIKLGISILPEGTISSNNENTILSSLLLTPYLKHSIPNSGSLLENPSRAKNFDLDLILLNQKSSKYEWSTMKNAPVIKYPFNKGLTLKGIINETLDQREKYKVQLFSYAGGVNEFAAITDKNEFYFNNFIASDSLKVNFTLVKNGEKYKELNYYPQIISNDKPFLKPLNIRKTSCVSTQKIANSAPVDVPTLKDAIELEDISIVTNSKKNTLNNSDKLGNRMSKGYKISEDDYKMYSNVVQYIAGHGFEAGIYNGNVYVRGRAQLYFTKDNVPTIFLDDMQVYDFNMLDDLSLKIISEIYLNPNGTSIQSTGTGVIKIYTIKDYRSPPRKSKAKSFMIKNAFAPENNFIAPEYTSYDNNGFKKYGTIFWEPNLDSETNFIKLTMPTLKQKTIKVLIEGMSADGKFISEVKTLILE